MIENILVSGLTMMGCIVVQCFIVSLVLKLLLALDRKRFLRPTVLRASCLLAAVMLIMVAGHLLQISLWAGVFFAYREFDDFSTAFYHSTVNFTTLGYGDLVMRQEQRLLGALEAASGVLMFGLTTSVMFTVMQMLMKRERERIGNPDRTNDFRT